MVENTIGRNITFPIYNEDGASFHDLVLKKATVDSIVMSLGDKVTGDVMYIDNSLSFTMKEYIVVDGVKYSLVNPPTIVREGMVADNSQLKGMTKYSFTFYHPMYFLGNIPFTDIAVTSDEEVYLSQNKTFSWVGNLFEFIAKLNANLANTEWVVISNITQSSDMWEKASKQSNVLTFDKQFISDALKTSYDTWDIPFVISQTNETIGGVQKKFKIEFGLPIEDIYTTNDQNERVPFVFQFGKGVGLKNNSRTPRNNKIVTRIIGEGSERNIPYGYPQIQWFGAQDAKFTYGDHAGVYTNVSVTVGGETHTIPKLVSYPIYKGILGGEWVMLIKHPFTRTKLMPKEYRESVINKVSIYDRNGDFNTHYNPDTEIIDYIDAIGSTYAHEINPLSPSAEMHTFEDIHPELLLNNDYGFISVTPIDRNLQPATDWDDTIDDEGNYVQSHFKVKLPQLQFDVYACAAITESMQINMKSGNCLGCTFDVEVDWEDYKKNFFHGDGTFDPVIHTTVGDGHVRDGAKYPDSSQGQIDLILKKDINTFGTVMPNVYQQPKGETSTGANDGDRFVFLGISLPNSYIISAETKLSYEMELYMKDNNNYYYDYPLKFDEHFLATHTDILSQIANNKKIRFVYGNQEIELYVKQITIKYGESVLPKYDIVLTDNIEVVLNQIGQAVGEMRHISDTFIVMNNDLRYEFNKANEKLERTIQKNGKINRFYYYAGEWEDTALKGNRVTDLEAPFFSYTTLDANNNPVVSYWVFNPQENGLYTWSEMGQPAESTTSNPTAWVRMISDFKYIITQAIFGEYAQFGSAIINGDWLLSTHGKRNGGDSQQYIYFDPQDPMGEISGNFAPNFCVDLLTGEIYAMSGSIGGFAIDDLNLVNTNYDAGVTIQNQYSTKQVVIGSTAIDPKTNRPVPIIAKMIESGGGSTPLHNTAIYLEARNAINNYAFHGAGNGVLEGYMQGWKVNQLTSYSTTQQLRLRDGAVQAVYRTTVNGGEFFLPRLGEVWETLGILDSQQNTSFCCELVIINQAAVSGNRDDATNYYEPRTVKILGDTTESRKYWTDLRQYSLSYAQEALPVILRDNGSRYLFIDNAYSAHFFLTYINGRYIANYIYG